ncbi:hypothetical protein DFS33DRAFT_1339317 [Desarmillaria ectypa]|nr:hypothetical protein DFS33DRAFT_1339317 [Desarmillaria ectypa]
MSTLCPSSSIFQSLPALSLLSTISASALKTWTPAARGRDYNLQPQDFAIVGNLVCNDVIASARHYETSWLPPCSYQDL